MEDQFKVQILLKRILARLGGIQKALSSYNSSFLVNLEKELLVEYNNIVHQERVLLAQKAGFERARMGDMNSKYFQTLAKIRNCRKKIACVKNQRGDWISNDADLKHMMVDYFKLILTTCHSEFARCAKFQSSVII